jgi:lipid II isoglutaminyl synthase (glutamine-hydrolysing)
VITIVPVYPALLSIYADRGNVRVLEQRSAWRGIPVRIAPLGLGEALDPATSDVILIGGGQDRDQVLVAEHLARQVPAIRSAVADGAALLAVCGGYQLLGHRYRGHRGDEIRGTGLVDLETIAGDTRLIGNVLIEAEVDGQRRGVVGFENHAGRTWLGAGVRPLGRVIAGAGNNGVDGTEGCVAGRVIGSYIHGPLLPKNPWLADQILAWGLARRGATEPLAPLDDALEDRAAAGARAIARDEGRTPSRRHGRRPVYATHTRPSDTNGSPRR